MTMDQPGLYRNASTAKTELFSKLKPCCIQISRLVVRPPERVADNSGPLQHLTDQLVGILADQIKYDASVLDKNIAEYIFFPLSFVFRDKESYAARVVENSVKCLAMLIQHGWRSATLSTNMAQELLILLTFIVAGVPGKERGPPPPEETAVECYKCLATLIRVACLSSSVCESLVGPSGLPSMGHAVTVILDGIQDGTTVDVQLAALDALRSLFVTMSDREALASFLPGSVSALSKILSPPASLKTQRRILCMGLVALKEVLVKVLGDINNRDILRQPMPEPADHGPNEPPTALSPSWLKASGSQVKLALAVILKLRNHESDDVRQAVEKLCLALLDACHKSLADCATFLVESAIITGDEKSDSVTDKALADHEKFTIPYAGSMLPQTTEVRITLQNLIIIHPELQETVKTVVYNFVTSLPRVMQSNDDAVKKQAIRALSRGQSLVKALYIESSMLSDALCSSLRDGVVVLASSTGQQKAIDDADVDGEISLESQAMITTSKAVQAFRPVMLAHGSQKTTREALLGLLATVGSPSQQAILAAEMLVFVRDTEGIDQVTSYWLSFELLKAALTTSSELDSFTDLSFSDTTDGPEEVFQELYSYSVSVLGSHTDSEDVDWRLEAIAVEVVSYSASRMGMSFRPELIDILYPTATLLGSGSPKLRAHAITTLNSLAASCGYQSVSELIVGNADYMVNSVSLRLNTFDITPALTQVLRMMIRLTGPKILPFLDDVVASIFTALENYHGYPAFVERLFAVLSEIVDQGVKSNNLLLESAQTRRLDHRKRPPHALTIEEIGTDIRERMAKTRKRMENVEDVVGRPQELWKSEATELLDKRQREMTGDSDGDGQEAEENEPEKPKAEPTPTYTILSRVTTLTQHYLTSPTPTLRKSILDLLATASPAMANDEDSFLPLLNSLWPVVISRLQDPEPYVVMASCRTIAAMAQGAGDFLASRIKTEWWESLASWCRKAKREAETARGSGGSKASKQLVPGGSKGVSYLGLPGIDTHIVLPNRSGGEVSTDISGKAATVGLGRFAQAAQVWEATVELLTGLVSYVRMDNEVFDEILELVVDDLGGDPGAREALEAVNADAVWLALYEHGSMVPEMAVPVLDGVSFAALEVGL